MRPAAFLLGLRFAPKAAKLIRTEMVLSDSSSECSSFLFVGRHDIFSVGPLLIRVEMAYSCLEPTVG